MTLKIELSADEEAWVMNTARNRGSTPAQVLKSLLANQVPVSQAIHDEDPALELFTRWEREDANMTANQIEQEARGWEEFKANVNAERDRAGARRVFWWH